jgi:hypothetical protein
MDEPEYMARLTEMAEDVYRRQRKAEHDAIAFVFGKPGQHIRCKP